MSHYSATILADSPQGYWRLDETSGTVAHDQTANHYDGAVSGATLSQSGAITSDTDTSMLFTAAGGFSVPYTLNPSTWSALSLEYWIKMSEQWHHVVIAVDATSTLLYLDGVAIVGGTGDAVLVDTDIYYSGSYTQSGLLDEIALYNYKLTPVQIAQHFTAGRALTYGSAVLHDRTNAYLYQKSFDMPMISEGMYKVARIEGVRKTGSIAQPKHILVVTRLVGTSRSDLESRLDTLYKGLALPQQQLSLHAIDARYFLADCVDAKTELAPMKSSNFPGSGVIFADVSMTFLCQQPYAYASSVSTYDTGVVALSANGAVYSFSTITVTGGGNVPTRPVIRLYNRGMSGGGSAITQITITQTTDNQSLTITSGFPNTNGDYLDIYCDPTILSNGYSIIKNGTGSALNYTGVFPFLEPTATNWTISFTTSGATSLSSQAIFTWTARWAS